MRLEGADNEIAPHEMLQVYKHSDAYIFAMLTLFDRQIS